MRLQDWCDYDNYDCLVGGCENCNLCKACECKLHCNYDVFSNLTKMETQEQINTEMERMLGYRKHPKLKGKYFWTLSCDGRGTYERAKPCYPSGVLEAGEIIQSSTSNKGELV